MWPVMVSYIPTLGDEAVFVVFMYSVCVVDVYWSCI